MQLLVQLSGQCCPAESEQHSDLWQRGNGRKDCERKYNSEPEGTMSSKGKVASARLKDVNDFQLTPGLADALTASLDASYLEYFTAACSGRNTKEAERRIAAIPEDKRYLTRVLDSLDSSFADFDTETAKLDLRHMQNRKPEAIKRYLEFRSTPIQNATGGG